MTNSKVTDVSDAMVNRILSPIASSMGQAQSQLYANYDDRLVEARKVNGINVRVYVTDPSNRNHVYQRYNEFIKASSDLRIPALLRNCVNIASFHDAQNPADYYWAMEYNAKRLTETFYSAATGGFGNFMSWHLAGASIDTVAHEFGHCFDTAFYAMLHNGQQGFFSRNEIKFGESNTSWERALNKDVAEGHPVHDRPYGANSLSEDFADCVRLFVLEIWS